MNLLRLSESIRLIEYACFYVYVSIRLIEYTCFYVYVSIRLIEYTCFYVHVSIFTSHPASESGSSSNGDFIALARS